MTTRILSLVLPLFLLSCSTTLTPSSSQEAQNRSFSYVSQKGVSGNACGPASLVNAFGAGSPRWQAALTPYSPPKSAILTIMKTYGSRPSLSFKNRNRWNKLMGMNLEDLTATAQEMAHQTDPSLPQIHSTITIPDGRNATVEHLKSLHRLLSNSFKNGLPPIANIARVAHRRSARNNMKVWDTVGSHSVVITSLSRMDLTADSPSFSITYVDPSYGTEKEALIHILHNTTLPTQAIHVHAPESNIFKSILSPETPNYLSLSSVIGAF